MSKVGEHIIQWDATCSFDRASNSKTKEKENSNYCSPQYTFAIIQPPMTQGQGEGKVK